jgi:hypothetical protein
MIVPVTMYDLVCDGCRVSVFKDTEFAAMSDQIGAEETAAGAGWKTSTDGRVHLCPGCADAELKPTEV